MAAGGVLGSLFGGHGSSHNSGNSGYVPNPGYYPQPQVSYQNKPKRSGLGVGGAAALGDYSVSHSDPN